jgi:hypothetical protein
MPDPPDEAASGAPLHLLQMAVGVADLEDLRRGRAERIRQYGASRVYTRNQPRRTEAVLAGGSLYWVIRGQVQARQVVTGFHSERDGEGRAYCMIAVAPELVATVWRPWRPFQGWRYLTPADAPPDLPAGSGQTWADREPLPERMLAELRALGLL